MNAVTPREQRATAVHKSIGAALAAAQAEMGPALKSANNPHFRTKYADLSSVTEACLPALSAHGIAVIQPPYDDDTGRYVKTVLIHGETGETLECRVPLIVQKNDMQGYGSAVTYARRYGLMSMAGIAPEDDDGNAAAKAAPLIEDRPRQQERRPDAKEEFERDVSAAIKAINAEKGLDSLGAYFGDLYRRQRPVADDQRVVAAKDARKSALAPRASTTLGDDHIPY